jgi:hypothetical protein
MPDELRERWQRLCSPLANFKSCLDRINFDGSLYIRRVPDDEVDTWREESGIRMARYLYPRWELKDVYEVVKELDPGKAYPTDRTYGAHTWALVLHAIRISMPGRVEIPAVIHCREASQLALPNATRIPHGPPMAMGNVYVETDEQASRIVDMWRKLYAEIHMRIRGLEVALELFEKSHEYPDDPDYRMLFLVMSTEALVLSDIGDRGELQYRFSHRVASYIGEDEKEKRRVYKVMKQAYEKRSSVAHGNRSPFTDWESVAQSASLVEECLQKLIRKMLHKGKSPDWGELLFS